MERIGLIGPGIMGAPMVRNLLGAGYRVWVYGRREEAVAPLSAAGAVACESPAVVAEATDIIITVVGDTPDVQEVVLGPAGILTGARAGQVLVDMSTISPSVTRDMARELASSGVEMLDAPVSGGEQGAVAGTLSIMVGGQEQVFRRVLPVLGVLGKNIVHVGSHGAGQVAKMCNQVVVAGTITAVAEAMLLARASGVDPARVREALLGGFAASRVLEVHGQRMLDADYRPGFMARLHQKDMRIVMEAAGENDLGLPGASISTQLINALVGQGGGGLDSSAVMQVLESLAGRARVP